MYLNCKTYFSYRYGTFPHELLVLTASELAVKTMALTNINNTSDIWDFVSACKRAGIKPVAGVEIRNEDTLCYLLLSRNNEGFFQINRFLSTHLIAKAPFPDRVELGADVFVIYPFNKEWLQSEPLLTVNEYMGVQTTEVNKLYGVDMQQWGSRLLMRHPVTFQDKVHYNVHRLLRAIDKNIILSKQEDTHKAGEHETFMPPATLLLAFEAYPQIIINTFLLMEKCSLDMDYEEDKNKKHASASKEDDRQLLEKLATDGLLYRYGKTNTVARERVLKELKIINDLNFNAYFLITWEILQYARSRGFFHVGRGSGANSIVAYCMQITDVDPIELDLYFERFLNPYRTSPPDFDIDFSWVDRDDIIDFVFKKYGKEHVALLGMYTTFQYKATVRELGKVYGLPKTEIDLLAEGRLQSDDKVHAQILRYSDLIKDFPNHLSIHPGGMLISENPIHYYTATDLPPKGFYTTQIDMFVAENISLFKFDILSQRGLGHIKDTVDLVRKTRGIAIDIHDVELFKQDKRVAQQIRSADTIGCFYIESPSMRQLLKKLRCSDYLTLVAASSIIRPGVGQSGMMQEYIYRYHNPDKFEYLHPKMKELLQETYGVMVYQEDVIKVAHHFGGLDMAESDILRRAMSGKYRGTKQMQRLEEQFFLNCKARGYDPGISREVWRQISSFAGYSFSKAHSASFAVESYQSLYLKTYYPVEFMVAVINNFGGFYNRALYFQQLIKHGATVYNPCINNSDYLTSIKNDIVYVGFIHIKDLERALMEKILEERDRNGAYLHLQDFIERTQVPPEQLNTLIKVNALRFTGKTKGELLWEANTLQKTNTRRIPAGQSLFQEPEISFQLPALKQNRLKDMMQDIELLGFTLENMFELVDADPYQHKLAADIPGCVHQTVTCLVYLICTKDTYTKKNKEVMHFGTWLDVKGDWVDSVHFPESARRYPFQKRGFYFITGKVIEEFGVHTIAVEQMEKAGIKKLNS
ncbi:DNA polymerase III subunit alpha [Chitinophaga pinensis]|uniref:DNA-directed DNA polymerase n=1 Tax=Chitinophaga pinensis (strain ATCC 43595 / DSM 2588 / LMG 13176 / NBRC 15968 / NCIMB 11800 / UQM 2034) TaxID=485918 RepID=A0A979G4X6_CHIPD|nr:DNA polymerase III subunit alpha [Chitinophaga pinensis]ACU60703.1 DNA polymerase III, alpha subunit [Chitinophaga pinensis DSM 2588]